MQFPSVLGATYIVQTTTTLTPPQWVNAYTSAGTGSFITRYVPMPSNGVQVFFRVVSF